MTGAATMTTRSTFTGALCGSSCAALGAAAGSVTEFELLGLPYLFVVFIVGNISGVSFTHSFIKPLVMVKQAKYGTTQTISTRE